MPIALSYSLADQDFVRTKSIGIWNVSTGLLRHLAAHPQVQRLTVFANATQAGLGVCRTFAEESLRQLEPQPRGNRHSSELACRLQNIDRNTPRLLPPDLRHWVAEDDLVHFVIQAVERLPLSSFAVNPKGCGDEPYPPSRHGGTGAADLLLCQRHFLLPAHRAGHLPGPRNRGTVSDREHPSGS